MEGGNKVNIPLDAPIDTQSSDMLVPVHSPKFEHNRQQYQGRALSNSVRFESDGWAAGDAIYDFDVTEPAYTYGDYRIYRYKGAEYGTYILEIWHVEDGKEVQAGTVLINYNDAIKSLYNIPSDSVSHSADDYGMRISLTFNGESGSISNYITADRYRLLNGSSQYLSLDYVINESGTVDFKVTDTRTEETIDIIIEKPTAVYAKSNLVDGEPYKLADFTDAVAGSTNSVTNWSQSSISIRITAPRAGGSSSMEVSGLPGEPVTGNITATAARYNNEAILLSYSFKVVQKLKYNLSFSQSTKITGIYDINTAYPNSYQSTVPVSAEEGSISGTVKPDLTKFSIDVSYDPTAKNLITNSNAATVNASVPLWNSLRVRNSFEIKDSVYTCTNYGGRSPQVVKLCTFHNLGVNNRDMEYKTYDGTAPRVSISHHAKVSVDVYATTVPASILVAGSSSVLKVDQTAIRPSAMQSNTYTNYFASTKETLGWVSWSLPLGKAAVNDATVVTWDDYTNLSGGWDIINYWIFDLTYIWRCARYAGYAVKGITNHTTTTGVFDPDYGGITTPALVFEYKDASNVRQMSAFEVKVGCFDTNYAALDWLYNSSSSSSTGTMNNYTSHIAIARQVENINNVISESNFTDATLAAHFRAKRTLINMCTNDVSSGDFTPYKNKRVVSNVYTKLVDPVTGVGAEELVLDGSSIDSDNVDPITYIGQPFELKFGVPVMNRIVDSTQQEDEVHGMIIGTVEISANKCAAIVNAMNSIVSKVYTYYSDSRKNDGDTMASITVADFQTTDFTGTTPQSQRSLMEHLIFDVTRFSGTLIPVQQSDTITYTMYGWYNSMAEFYTGIAEPVIVAGGARYNIGVALNYDYFSSVADTQITVDIQSKVHDVGIYPYISSGNLHVNLYADAVTNKTTLVSRVISASLWGNNYSVNSCPESSGFMHLTGAKLLFNATGGDRSSVEIENNYLYTTITTSPIPLSTHNGLPLVVYGVMENSVKVQDYISNNYSDDDTYYGADMVFPVNPVTLDPPSFSIDDSVFIAMCRAVTGGNMYKYTDGLSHIYTFSRMAYLSDIFSLVSTGYIHSKDIKFSAGTKPTITVGEVIVGLTGIKVYDKWVADRTLATGGSGILKLSIDNNSSVDSAFEGRINILATGTEKFIDFPIATSDEYSPVNAFDKNMYYIDWPATDSAAESNTRFNAYIKFNGTTALFKFFESLDDISIFMSPAASIVTHDFYKATLPTMPNHVAVYDMTKATFNTTIVDNKIKLARDSMYQYILLCLNYDDNTQGVPENSCVLLSYKLEPEDDGSNKLEIVTQLQQFSELYYSFVDKLSVKNKKYAGGTNGTYRYITDSPSTNFKYANLLDATHKYQIEYDKSDYTYSTDTGKYIIEVGSISGGNSYLLPDPEQLATNTGVSEVPYLDASVELTYASPTDGTLDNTGNNYCNVLPDVKHSNGSLVNFDIDNGVISIDSNTRVNLFSGIMQYKDDTFMPTGNLNKQYIFNDSYYEYCKVLATPFGAYAAYAQEGFSLTLSNIYNYDARAEVRIYVAKEGGGSVGIDYQKGWLTNTQYDNNITFKYGVPEKPEETFDSTGPAVPIATLNFDDEYQFLKQQWEVTDKVENFWFINPYGDVLVLDKFNFTYRERQEDSVNDWDGNNYVDRAVTSRAAILAADVVKYGVTNVNSAGSPATSELKAYLWAISMSDGNLTLKLYTMDKVNGITLHSTHNLYINKVAIGEMLNVNVTNMYLNTYSDISTSDLVFDAKYSSVAVAGRIVFGIHLDNNFNQWAVVINTSTSQVEKVIQGYGYVGLDGTLTGGQIPDMYFDSSKGFKDTVRPLDYLNTYNGTLDGEREVKNIAELYVLPAVVVGTDVQQWYIGTKVSGIVSRLKFDQTTGEFTKQVLPITNGYSVVYDSPSFYTRMITDKDIKIKQFKDILPDYDNLDSNVKKLFSTFMMFAANPNIFMLIPRISLSGYLQQTLGQYAYVHYTSNNVTVQKEDVKKSDLQEESGLDVNDEEEIETVTSYNKLVSSDELSFNTQIVKQTAKADEYQFPFLMLTLTALSVSAADMLMDKLQVNNKQNQTATNDKGRKFSQVFLQNMDALSASNMNQSGLTPTMTSVVAGTCTLDMFYSTSDKQHIYAGPGFVSHNFVAQCVAQSVTSTHFELNQLSMQYIFKHLTLFPTMLLVKALESTQSMLYSEANITGRLEVTAMGSGTNAAGVAAGIVLAIFAEALNVTIKLYNTFLNFAEKILDALGGDKLQSNITAMQSRHSYEIEGKHKYGEKNETFMWPCWGCGENKPYADETVVGKVDNKAWALHQKKWDSSVRSPKNYDKNTEVITDAAIPFVTRKTQDAARLTWQSDEVPYFIANCYGKSNDVLLPNDYAYVIGTEAFLSKTPFRNENIDCSEPVFATQVAQDYIIDRNWRLGRTTAMGQTTWISCDDTKILDGEPSNMVVTPFFCGVASPYAAIEIRRGVNPKFVRPWAVTPEVLAFNHTGKNAIYKHKLYHAFDGIGQRLVNWVGPAAMNKQKRAMHYCFQANDRFKRSNKLPPSQWFGNFDSSPVVCVDVDVEDKLYNDVMMPSKNIGMDAGVVGEYKNVTRYSLPVFSEFINTLPSTVRTLAPYKLAVVDGITSLTTDMRNTQSAYKAPESIDFTINKQIYRMTPEYICAVRTEKGVTVTEDLCPTLGLTYIGATPFEAFFYSQATRQYYSYTGGTSLTVVDMLERFRDIQSGKYDFVSQQVVMQCLATFDRLDRFVHDDSDETDNIMVLLFKDRAVSGELQPPTTVLFNSNSWFKIISMPTGVVYQGPNRCSINRTICNEYMYKGITDNALSNSWIKMSREDYHPFRTYIDTNGDEYRFTSITADRASQHIALMGWTHNPFLLVTSPLGISQDVDCLYEWTVTFAWTHDMDNIYTGEEFYACVNVMAETYANGGKVLSRPTHVYLTRNLFARSNNPGYYSFTYQSKNGAGNRERLHIWCDSFIAISSIQCEYKPITEKRNSVLTSQSDVSGMKEF